MTRRRRWIAGGLLAGTIALLTSLSLSDPATWGSGGCPTLTLLKVQCPGCGTMRALHRLLNGNLAGAWRYNPAMIVALPVLLWWIAFEGSVLFRGKPLLWPKWQPKPIVYLVIAGVLVLWGVVRNIPGLEMLRPPA